LVPVVYSHLNPNDDLEVLLRPGESMALLYEVSPGHGHWTLLTRDDVGDVEFFDPYGLAPDAEESAGASYSARNGPVLSNILSSWAARTGGHVTYNAQQVQQLAPNDDVCGRYTYLRWLDRHVPLKKWLGRWGNDLALNDKMAVWDTVQSLLECDQPNSA